MAAQCCTSRIFAFEWEYFSLTHCFSVISEHITNFQKLDALGYISIADSVMKNSLPIYLLIFICLPLESQ